MSITSAIQKFTNISFRATIRVLDDEDGEVLFCANDVAQALNYARPNNAIHRHCRYIIIKKVPHSQIKGTFIRTAFIPEPDVYRLISRSKMPNADKFERWIFEEILPCLRQQGRMVGEQMGLMFNVAESKELMEAAGNISSMKAELNRLSEKVDALYNKDTEGFIQLKPIEGSAAYDWINYRIKPTDRN